MDPTEIDWDALLAEAIDAMKHAYCPYSNFPVGAEVCWPRYEATSA